MKRVREEEEIGSLNLETLSKAISEGNVTLTEACLQGMSSQIIKKYNSRFLALAITADKIKILELFLKYDIAIEDDIIIAVESICKGYPCLSLSPLHYAIREKLHQSVQFLVGQQVKITEKDLNTACFGPTDSNNEIFNILLKSNALTFYPDKHSHQRCYFNLAIQKGHIGTIQRSLALLDVSTTQIYHACYGIPCIKLAIESCQDEAFRLLSLFYLNHHEIIRSAKKIKQMIFYHAIRRSIVEIVQILVNPIHIQEIDLENEIFFDNACGPSALYFAIKTRQSALENSEEKPEDLNVKKTIENNNEIIMLLLNIGSDFGHKSSYSPDQVEAIEHSKRTCITPLYSKAVEGSSKQFSAAGIGSIIAEYVTPDYAPTPAASSFILKRCKTS